MTSAVGAGGPGRAARLLPIAGWLPRYERRWLRGDVAAGVAVTALVVPKNLGYAGIAGIPLQNGLYAAAAGALIYAVFCTSKQISTGPSSSLAAVAGGAVLVTGVGGEDAAQLVAAIALVTGLLFLVLAVLRMGWIARFLSKAVVTGFLAGAAIDVVIGELPKLTGTSADETTAWSELGAWTRTLGDISWTTLLVGAVALGAILALRLAAPAVPGALVLLVGGLLASAAFDLGVRGVALVGDVPRGLPAPELPDLGLVSDHLGVVVAASAALLLIGFSQTAGDARAFAARHRYRVDLDQESAAQGMANAGAGLFQGMPVSTSLSASSLNESSGARTPAASLVTGGMVLATLVVLAPLFSDLPTAVLAAIIIDAVVFGMIDVAEFRRLARVSRFDLVIAAAALVAVLAAGVLAGVMIGLALSLGWLVYVATRPPMSLDEAVLHVDGGLFFATSEALEERVRAVLDAATPPAALVLDLAGVGFMDAQGAAAVRQIDEVLAAEGVVLHLARARPQVLQVLGADGVLDSLGAGRVHPTLRLAIRAQGQEARIAEVT